MTPHHFTPCSHGGGGNVLEPEMMRQGDSLGWVVPPSVPLGVSVSVCLSDGRLPLPLEII